MTMDKVILYCKNREEWRNWLFTHFENEHEVFLVFPTISAHQTSVNYNDAVEEALCVGWIDGIAYRLDDKHQIRRFTPRKNNKKYSQLNIERLIYLNNHNLIHPKLVEQIKKIIEMPYIYPKKIINVLQKDEEVWANYLLFPESYKRIRIAYILDAKDYKEYKKRLDNFIAKTKENKIITGYGGSDKYYRL